MNELSNELANVVAFSTSGFMSRATQNCHFGDVSPSQSLGLVWKTLTLTQQT